MLGYFIIFIAKIADVSLMTIRVAAIIRGKKAFAAMIGFLEALILMLALNIIFQNIDNITNIVAYALGFASGNYIGCWIDEKLALGYANVQIIPKAYNTNLASELRQKGFGVTSVVGQGKEGSHQVLNVVAKRKEVNSLIKTVKQYEPDCFTTVIEPKYIYGGYIKKSRL